MEEVEARFHEVAVHPDRLAAARALQPIHERQSVGRSILLFEGADRQQLAALGDVRTPSVADLFVAILSARQGQDGGATR
jgi:ABC-2 type transport system ATP-binding protein